LDGRSLTQTLSTEEVGQLKVWLDDVRPAPDGWVLAKNVQEAQAHLEAGEVTHLSLDHDLGGDGPDAYALCLWMAENNVWPTESIGIHSYNPVGRENMRAVINRYSPFFLS
jgi:hypothetical protein